MPVCFRGTSDVEDAITDLQFLTVDPDPRLRKAGNRHVSLMQGILQAILRPCKAKMHRGFCYRASEHIDFIVSLRED